MVIAEAQAKDAADPNPGYESFGDYGVDVDQFLFGGWVPGTPPLEFPPTIGHVAQPGSHLLLQMHYGPSPVVQTDQTEINLFFAEEPIQREVETFIMDPTYLDGGWGSFVIPANQVTTFHGSVTMWEDISLIGVTPHCHLLGQAWEVFARSPNAQDTIPLISIPQWDFNWQGIFTYPQMVRIPAGYVVEAYATYDNTTNNQFNPNTPPQDMVLRRFHHGGNVCSVLTRRSVRRRGRGHCAFCPRPKHNGRVPTRQFVSCLAQSSGAGRGQDWISLAPAGRGDVVAFRPARKKVKSLLSHSDRPAGRHLESFSVESLTPGTYLYQLQTSTGTVRSAQLQVLGH